MAGPFKMKGSPFQRNFGIGSPLHQGLKKEEKQLEKKFIGPKPKAEPMVDENKNKIPDIIESRESLEGKLDKRELPQREIEPPTTEKKKKKPVEDKQGATGVEDKQVEDKEVPTRPTSWFRGEEGWIPDSWQSDVNRPEVPTRKKKKKKGWFGFKDQGITEALDAFTKKRNE